MCEMKHLVVTKFKEGVMVQDIIRGMEALVSQVDHVSSFEWGEDVKSEEMLRQGFTHAFLMTFKSEDDFTAFLSHPKHLEFSATFSEVIDKVLLLDFPAVLVKPPNDIGSAIAPPSPPAADEADSKPAQEPTCEGEAVAPPAAPPSISNLSIESTLVD